jgi:hypothetical protein
VREALGDEFLILPDAMAPYEVKLDKPAKDSLTGKLGASFRISPGEGRILVTSE